MVDLYMNVKTRGFTLVELIVAVVVMAMVVTIGVVSLNKFGSSQKIEEAREGLMTSIRLARNYAVTGQNIDSESLKYVTFSVDVGGNVKIYPNGLSDGPYYLNKDISPEGTNIAGVPDMTLRFASHDGKLVDSAGRSLSAEVNFTISSGSGMEDPGGTGGIVRVSPSGLINE